MCLLLFFFVFRNFDFKTQIAMSRKNDKSECKKSDTYTICEL